MSTVQNSSDKKTRKDISYIINKMSIFNKPVFQLWGSPEQVVIYYEGKQTYPEAMCNRENET